MCNSHPNVLVAMRSSRGSRGIDIVVIWDEPTRNAKQSEVVLEGRYIIVVQSKLRFRMETILSNLDYVLKQILQGVLIR